jgi:hypothetical protein
MIAGTFIGCAIGFIVCSFLAAYSVRRAKATAENWKTLAELKAGALHKALGEPGCDGHVKIGCDWYEINWNPDGSPSLGRKI